MKYFTVRDTEYINWFVFTFVSYGKKTIGKTKNHGEKLSFLDRLVNSKKLTPPVEPTYVLELSHIL